LQWRVTPWIQNIKDTARILLKVIMWRRVGQTTLSNNRTIWTLLSTAIPQ